VAKVGKSYNNCMNDQASHWSRVADRYEQEFVDPYERAPDNPILKALERIDGKRKTVADLGCGIGPLLPRLAKRFARVLAIDFAPQMLHRARERCAALNNVEFHECRLTDLSALAQQADVAVAINSLVMPSVGEIESSLKQVRQLLRPGGLFFGIVPAIDSVHYHTMLLLDRARGLGMPEEKARENATVQGEHALYDFAFGRFTYLKLEQHFWQPFEIAYRLKRAGFVRPRRKRLRLDWSQFAAGADLGQEKLPWDWCFRCETPKGVSHA
jgi:SAM-dependent methyltransferase